MVSLDHINMNVRNLPESIKWYKKTFNFEIVELGKSHGLPFAVVSNQ